MPRAQVNEIIIEYDTFGRNDADPLLLVMGLGAQLVFWEEEFCESLANKGFYVIRFDNRDCGLSTKFDKADVPSLKTLMSNDHSNEAVALPYTMDDLADDSIGLLDALGIQSAHLVGASMGGMIVQTVGWRHRERVRSITSIMSTTGDPSLPPPSPEALSVLFPPPVSGKDEYVENALKSWEVVRGSGYVQDIDRIRKRSERSWDRCYAPEGVERQMAAILGQGSRKAKLSELSVPFLVIHGTDDPLLSQECGQDTADTVSGAEIILIDGMGHDMPRETWPIIINGIANLALA